MSGRQRFIPHSGWEYEGEVNGITAVILFDAHTSDGSVVTGAVRMVCGGIGNQLLVDVFDVQRRY